MASRGHAGGLASTSAAAAAVFDAAGFDIVLLETVGTGQSEVEVAAAADTTVVLEAPEMGDEVQAIKAGLLEVADIVVVNKGDRPGPSGRRPSCGRCSCRRPPATIADAARPARSARTCWSRPPLTGEGVPELLGGPGPPPGAGQTGADAGRTAPPRRGAGRSHPRGTNRRRLSTPARAAVARDVYDAVARHELDPYAASDRLLQPP